LLSQHARTISSVGLLVEHTPRVIESSGVRSWSSSSSCFRPPSPSLLTTLPPVPHKVSRFSLRRSSLALPKWRTAWLWALVTRFSLQSFHHLLLSASALADAKPTDSFDAQLPYPHEIVRDFLFYIFLREILFCYSRNILHLPSLYPGIHKLHQRFTAPMR
jgi:hypothetical protein